MSKNRRKPRVCFVLNIAPSYREAILKLLDSQTDVDYYFCSGDKDMHISNLFDISSLSGFKSLLKNRFKGTKLIWQKGWFKLLFAKFDTFVLTGNPGIRSNWLLMILARMMGKRVYLWSHGLHGNETKLQKITCIIYNRLATGMFLYGSYGKMNLINSGYKKAKINVIYNSLDVEKQQKLRAVKEDNSFIRNYFGNDNPVAIFLGRLTPQKSLSMIIDAIALLKAAGRECNVLIVGCGSEEQKLRDRAEELDVLDNIWFYGECFDEAMNATLFKCSTLCISPGNVGLTAMHSMAYGVPVITHNLFSKQMPEFEAIRRGITGDFFKYNDTIDLSDKIERWLTFLSDPKNRELSKRGCYKVVDTIYNPQNQVKIFNTVILGK